MLIEEKPFVHPVVFEDIDESMVKEEALKTKGGSGPSGLDGDEWRKILVFESYGTINAELKRTFANFFKKICTEKRPIEKMKHHSKHFWLADPFPLIKTYDYD